jgi:hypothetical protein
MTAPRADAFWGRFEADPFVMQEAAVWNEPRGLERDGSCSFLRNAMRPHKHEIVWVPNYTGRSTELAPTRRLQCDLPSIDGPSFSP